MNKKIRNLIIGGVVLVLLVGVLLVLKFLPEKQEESSSEASSYTSSSIQVISEAVTDIDHIEVTNEFGVIKFLRKADNVYEVDGLEGIDQNSSAATIFNAMGTITATRIVEENPSDLTKYGLDKDTRLVEITYKDGRVNRLKVGDTLPTGSGCYGQLNDEPAVYALGALIQANTGKKLMDFVDTTIIPTWVQPTPEEGEEVVEKTEPDILSMSIVGGALKDTLGDTPFAFEMGAESAEMAAYGVSSSTWNIVSPVHASLHTENSRTIREGVYNLAASGVVMVHPEETDLEAMGLDEPYAVVDFNREKEEFILTIGDQDGEGNRYVMVSGKDVVYTVAESSLPWISVQLNKMLSFLIYTPHIDKVSQIDVTVDGKSYTFQLFLGEPEEEGEDPKVETVSYNGQSIDMDHFRKLYQYFLSAPAEDINLDHQTGPEVASITYHYFNLSKTDTMNFYQISDRRCALGLNGNADFTARSLYLTRLAENIERVINGEAPDLDY